MDDNDDNKADTNIIPLKPKAVEDTSHPLNEGYHVGSTELTKRFFTEETMVDLNTYLDETIVPPVPIITGLIEEGGSIFLYAPSGAGKSIAAMSLTLLAASKPASVGAWDNGFGMHKILYLDAELTNYEGQRRLRQLKKAMGVDDNQFVYWNAIRNKTTDLHLLNRDHQQQLLGVLRREKFKLVVIDNVRSLAYGEDENSSASVQEFNKFIDKIHEIGCSAFVIHHNNKEKSKDGWSNYAGSSNFERPYSAMINLKTIQKWTKEAPQQVVEFRIAKERSTNINLQGGLITICDEEGLKVEAKGEEVEEVIELTAQERATLKLLKDRHPDIMDDEFEFGHGEAKLAWISCCGGFKGTKGYKQSAAKNINKLVDMLRHKLKTIKAQEGFNINV